MLKPLYLFAAMMLVASTFVAASDNPRAVMLAAPRAHKSAEAARRHLAGKGIFVVDFNSESGFPTAVYVQQSTGNDDLDKSAMDALRRWRAKPAVIKGIRLKRLRVPFTFVANRDESQL